MLAPPIHRKGVGVPPWRALENSTSSYMLHKPVSDGLTMALVSGPGLGSLSTLSASDLTTPCGERCRCCLIGIPELGSGNNFSSFYECGRLHPFPGSLVHGLIEVIYHSGGLVRHIFSTVGKGWGDRDHIARLAPLSIVLPTYRQGEIDVSNGHGSGLLFTDTGIRGCYIGIGSTKLTMGLGLAR